MAEAPGTPLAVSTTVGALLDATTEALASQAEARWVVGHVLGTSGADLAARRRQGVSDGAHGAVASLVARRRAGEPLQYVLGAWDFRTLELLVDPRVLIPRPETEELVEVALGELRRSRAGSGRPGVVVDLGTGSGAIGLSIAAEAPASDLAVWVTDVSGDALAVARANLALLAAARPAAAARVRVTQGSWFAALPPALGRGVDLVVSNPPYVAEGEWADLDPEVRDHEPRGALVAGPTGTEALAAILRGALPWLGTGAGVVLELAPAQAGAAQDLARSLGYSEVTVRPDLAGRPRVLVARTPSSSPPGP